MERVVTDHWDAIGNAGTDHHIRLVVDEWGAWYGNGTQLGPELQPLPAIHHARCSAHRHHARHLPAPRRQGRHGQRGPVDQLHSLAHARAGRQFTVTPTFHVFQMYLPHRGAQAVRTEFTAAPINNPLANAPIPAGGNSYIGSLHPSRHWQASAVRPPSQPPATASFSPSP